MHVGSLDPNGTRMMKSKTEAMFFPATTLSTAAHAAATADIIFGDQNQYYISFTDKFQYLGSRITTDLKDIADINNRLRQAKGQVATLGTFFHTDADTWSKRLIFLAIPTNTALYGAESWTLTAKLRRRISAFYHTSICRILGINMHHVEEYKIQNEHIRNHFSVPDPLDLIRKRQFNLLGKFAHLVPPAFLVNSSPHGWANPVDPGDNTTRFATPMLTCFNISSRLFPIMAPLTLG
jgi:hypothetical protein